MLAPTFVCAATTASCCTAARASSAFRNASCRHIASNRARKHKRQLTILSTPHPSHLLLVTLFRSCARRLPPFNQRAPMWPACMCARESATFRTTNVTKMCEGKVFCGYVKRDQRSTLSSQLTAASAFSRRHSSRAASRLRRARVTTAKILMFQNLAGKLTRGLRARHLALQSLSSRVSAPICSFNLRLSSLSDAMRFA